MQNLKWHSCDRCGKHLSSYHSLWRHKKKCQVNNNNTSPSIGEKRPLLNDDDDIATFDGDEFCGKKPKSRATIEKMMKLLKVPEYRCDKITAEMLQASNSKPNTPSAATTEVLQPKAALLLKKSPSVQQESQTTVPLPKIQYPTKLVQYPTKLVKYIRPKSLGELWCNEDNNISTSDSEEEEEEDDTDEEVEKEGGKIRYDDSEKLQLKSHDGSDKDDPLYSDTESEEEEEEEEEEEKEDEQEDVKSLIQSTTKYLTTEDYNELIHLLQDIENEADPDFINSVVELKKLIDKFLVNEFDRDDGELILPKIMDLCRAIKASSNISLSKQQRIKMLLNDIDENRFRVESILTRLAETEDEDDILNTLEQLRREELISPQQFEKLMQDDAAFELPSVVKIIRNTKAGRGLKFLPRNLGDLTSKLKYLIEEGHVPIKDLLSYLDEIFRQKGISSKAYLSIKKDMDNITN